MWPFNSWSSLKNKRTETGARFYVRSAFEADVELVIPLKLSIWRDTYGHLMPEDFFQAAENSTQEQIDFWRSRTRRTAEVDPRLFVAEDLTNRLVGLATVERPTPERIARLEALGVDITGTGGTDVDGETVTDSAWVEVRNIYVQQELYGTPRLAAALLATAVGDTRAEQNQLPRKNVIAAVPTGLPRALRFFENNGFVAVGEPSTIAEGPWAGLEEQLMVRYGA